MGQFGALNLRPISKTDGTTETAGVAPADRGAHPTCETEIRKSRTAQARIVINAAGPWVDQLLEQASTANSPRLIGGTKGSHLIVAPFAGAPDTAIYVEAQADARPFFIIPWNGNYLIGTTDIRYDGDLDDVRIETEEIEYLLNETNRVIPQANLKREDILYTYSGVRPLPFTGDKDEQSITQEALHTRESGCRESLFHRWRQAHNVSQSRRTSGRSY